MNFDGSDVLFGDCVFCLLLVCIGCVGPLASLFGDFDPNSEFVLDFDWGLVLRSDRLVLIGGLVCSACCGCVGLGGFWWLNVFVATVWLNVCSVSKVSLRLNLFLAQFRAVFLASSFLDFGNWTCLICLRLSSI